MDQINPSERASTAGASARPSTTTSLVTSPSPQVDRGGLGSGAAGGQQEEDIVVVVVPGSGEDPTLGNSKPARDYILSVEENKATTASKRMRLLAGHEKESRF